MNRPDDPRRAELIAAALAGDLSPDETAEFDAMRADDPSIDAELADLDVVAARLDAAAPAPWQSAEPSAALRARIDALGVSEDARGMSEPVPLRAGRRRRWPLVAAAAACLAVGLAVGATLPGFLDAPPSGPPGTLGAIEAIDLDGEPDGTTIDADLVAHTWGTEAVLDASGLEIGAVYSIVMIATDGTEHSAGAMLGSDVPIHCRVNAAVLREDVVAIEIRDADSIPIAVADLPSP
jgi:hypothetical protein